MIPKKRIRHFLEDGPFDPIPYEAPDGFLFLITKTRWIGWIGRTSPAQLVGIIEGRPADLVGIVPLAQVAENLISGVMGYPPTGTTTYHLEYTHQEIIKDFTIVQVTTGSSFVFHLTIEYDYIPVELFEDQETLAAMIDYFTKRQ